MVDANSNADVNDQTGTVTKFHGRETRPIAEHPISDARKHNFSECQKLKCVSENNPENVSDTQRTCASCSMTPMFIPPSFQVKDERVHDDDEMQTGGKTPFSNSQ
jgi:hypothetical protein